MPCVFAAPAEAAEYYDQLPDIDSRALFIEGRIQKSWFFNQTWCDNIVSFARRLVPRQHLVDHTDLTEADRNLLSTQNQAFWQASSSEQRAEALCNFPIHKLLCSPRHEFHFLYEGQGRSRIRDTTRLCAGMSAPQHTGCHPEVGPTHSTGDQLNINVIGRDTGGRFVIDSINLFDGNRRGVSLMLNFIRGLVLTSDQQRLPAAALVLGHISAKIFINGFHPGAVRRHSDHWIPGDSICTQSILASNDRGGDGSLKIRVDVPFSTQEIALAHRGRPLGQVVSELQRFLPF